MAKTKFQKNLELTHKGIKEKRAAMHNEDAQEASIQYLTALKTQKRGLERKLLDLEDLQVQSTTSLKVIDGKFDATAWIAEMNQVKCQLKLHAVKMETAEEIHSDWFGS